MKNNSSGFNSNKNQGGENQNYLNDRFNEILSSWFLVFGYLSCALAFPTFSYTDVVIIMVGNDVKPVCFIENNPLLTSNNYCRVALIIRNIN